MLHVQNARLALVGANGKGKSTLVKLVTGDLAPVAGTVVQHPQARTAVFAQHNVEELVQDRGESSPLSYMQSLFPGVKEQELRKQLGSFGIKGALATHKLKQLSGGQAVRVQLAAIAFTGPHLLVLVRHSYTLKSCLHSQAAACFMRLCALPAGPTGDVATG